MGVTASNLTEGPGTLYSGLFGAVEPLDASVNAAPAASAWTDMGGTMDGSTFRIAQTYKELEVDQVVDVPGRRLTKRDVSIKTNLAEPTLANLASALNASAPVTGTGYASYDPAFATSAVNPTYSAYILDGYAPGGVGGFRRRVILRRALSTDDVESSYKKDGQTVIPVTFSGHYVSAAIAPFHIVDQTA